MSESQHMKCTHTKQGFKVHIYSMARGGYTLCFKGPNGRKRESAASMAQAELRATEVLSQLCAARSDLLSLSIEEVAEYRAARTLLDGKSLRTAVDFYLAAQAAKPQDNRPFSALIAAFLSEKIKSGVSSRHADTLRQHLDRFAGAFKGVTLPAIRRDDLDIYLHGIGSPRTWLNHRITLVTFFKWARTQGALPLGVTVAEDTVQPILPGQDPGILTPGELTRLLAVVDDPQLKLFIAIGAFAGLRPSEIERLHWWDISENCIILGRGLTKTKRRRVVPITDNLQAWLGARTPNSPLNTPVVGTRMHRKLEQACRAAGLEWPHNALRHSSISYSMALTKDAAAVAEAHGHSISRMQESYKANVTESCAREWFAIMP